MLSFILLSLAISFSSRTGPLGNVSFEMYSTHSTDSTGGSMFVNHTDVRMARTKVRGGLNLVCNLYETSSEYPK